MDPSIIAVAGVLLGVLVGGLLTRWNSTFIARLDMKWQQVRLRQEKLEEIATILEQIDKHYKRLMGSVHLKVVTGEKIDFGDECIPFDRLRILMQFYAPTMLEDWSKLENARKLFAKALIDATSDQSRTEREKQNINERAFVHANKMSEVCRLFMSQAALLSHEVVNNEVANKRG